ncbi:putative cytochrome p450 protein [Rosellinia necatrix]|uniref:Putative cytochrome p450 protein n=1 Tax=Rosellinia necatrix TaxID=77044 RepID=A0A1W2TKG1_ROSNE|nr:putative cytochrome p450 protein [Rosellinia necatrix]
MPYWIPVIGHTFNFVKNYAQLIEDGLNYVQRSREPFAIQLLGQKLCVCTSPKDVSAVFDRVSDFSFDNHLTYILTSFGIQREALERAWHVPEPGDWCYIPNNPINPKQKSLIHRVEDIYKQQLLPGDRMDSWCQTFLESISASLRVMDDLAVCTAKYHDDGVRCHDRSPRQISLYSLVTYFNVQASTRAMFGPHLHEIDPKVVEHMAEFNEHVWMVVFRCPNVFGLPVDKPRRKLMAIMRAFATRPADKRAQSSWAINGVLTGMDNVGMDLESKASMLLMIFWAAISNEHNACYWLLTYLLYDTSLLKLAKEETEAAWRSEQLDIKYLCSNCPNLESIYNEVLRLNNTAAAVRVASQDTEIGGKTLRAGSMVILPFRQLHVNENVWGDDALTFKPDRFMRNKSQFRSSSFRPFGGGATLCPGQTLAKQEIFGFIAILLHRFHISLARGPDRAQPPFPRLNSATPSFGVNGPIKHSDILVDIGQSGVQKE